MNEPLIFVVIITPDDRTHYDPEGSAEVFQRELQGYAEKMARFWTRGSIPAVEVKRIAAGDALVTRK